MNVYVLGVDVSLNGTGLCISGINGYATSVIKLKSGGDRLDKWKQIVNQIIGKATVADLVVIEDYAYGASSSSTIALAELGGVIRWELSKIQIPYLVVGTGQVKKFATGKGVAPKNVMLKEIYRRYSVDFNDDNMADAFVLAKIGEAVMGCQKERLTAFQIDVVKALSKDFQIPPHRYLPNPAKDWE